MVLDRLRTMVAQPRTASERLRMAQTHSRATSIQLRAAF
jgi:hypothetical protein